MFTRMRQGWELTKKAWSVVRRHPQLIGLTIRGGVTAVVVSLVVGGPGLWLAASDVDSAVAAGWVLVALAAYLASFAVAYYNVALAAAADEALAGREPDLRAATSRARSVIPAIAVWTLLSTLVNLVLSALRDRGGTAGRIVSAVGGAAWGFVTFFVVPVIAIEGTGAVTSIKRSAGLVRQKWGQQVTGNVAIGGLATVVTIVGSIVFAIGIALVVTDAALGVVAGAVLILAGAAVAITGMVVAGAMRGVFGVALYHFGVDDEAVGPFEVRDLASAAS